MTKKLLIIILILLATLPLAAKAQVLYLDCYAQNNCGLCDALDLMQKLAEYILMLAGSVSLLFFVTGGIMFLTSAGNQGRIMTGKKLIISSLIGVLIVYFAWAGVNFILWNFAGGQDVTGEGVARIFSRPWNEIECIREPDARIAEKPYESLPAQLGGCKSAWESGDEISCGGSCVGFDTSGIKEEQCYDASTALVNLFKCMDYQLRTYPQRYAGLQKKDIILTSISDDNGLKFCRKHYSKPPCFHMQNSCHYGHGKNDGSYAADIRSYTLNGTQRKSLEYLVSTCGGNFIDETYVASAPHFHISAKECGGR